ncbi:MAG TPA: hypothetical protein VGC41_02480 [Kofleriaceae bacterium]
MKIVLALGLVCSVASAEPVNLVTHAPMTFAVSSTVDSATFLPDHLIDGVRTTAWNSAAGDTRAWIAFRVPADAHVTAIKMTVGFTARNWFEQNLRIAKVTVEHGGKTTPAQLNPNSTELQSIALDGDGGDYTIHVTSTVPGTNKAWDEVIVSELEVWGTSSQIAKQKPRVIIGSLDIDCVHALWPKARGGRIGKEAVRSVTYSDPLCVIDRGEGKSRDHTTTIALMRGTAVADKLEQSLSEEQSLTSDAFVLGGESALLVTEASDHQGEMTAANQATHTLYRIASGKLLPVFSYDTHSQGVEQWSENHSCDLAVGAPGKPLPALVLTCTDAGSSAEGTPSPTTKSVTKLRWTGAHYE